MKNLLIIFISAIFLYGCSTTADENSDFNENYNPYTNTTTNAENKMDSSTKAVPYNGLKKSDVEDVFRRSSNENSNSIPTAVTQPLPENSEISTQMNEKGFVLETRTFKDHPVLTKIEKTTISPKNTELKVYFKNGKVYDVPDGKIEDFRTASIKSICQSVNVPDCAE